MKKLFPLFVLVVAVALLVQGCGSSSKSEGYIVYQVTDTDGKPEPELVVLDAAGEELRRVRLPDGIGRLYPSAGPLTRHVLYQEPIVSEKWFLVDVTSGALQEYDGFGRPQESAQPCGFASKWVALCGKQGVYLLDVDSGEVSDTPIELDPAGIIPAMVELVTPDESYLALMASKKMWLVPAAAPEKTRHLGADGRAIQVSISGDSESVVYTQRTASETQIVKERIDGSNAEIILSGQDIVRAALAPKHARLVVIRSESVSSLSLDGGEERELFTPVDFVREVRFDPDGKKAVFGAGGLRTEEIEWTYADLEKGTAEPLDELTGYERAYGRPASRWVFLTDEFAEGGDARIASLDLTSAQVRALVTLKDVTRFELGRLTQDGRVGWVMAFTEEGEQQIWLLVADKDGAHLLGDLSKVMGLSLSPDGKWVVLSVREESGDQTQISVKMVATDSGEERVIGEGILPVWAKP